MYEFQIENGNFVISYNIEDLALIYTAVLDWSTIYSGEINFDWEYTIPIEPYSIITGEPYPATVFRRTARKNYPKNSYYFNDFFDEFYSYYCNLITEDDAWFPTRLALDNRNFEGLCDLYADAADLLNQNRRRFYSICLDTVDQLSPFSEVRPSPYPRPTPGPYVDPFSGPYSKKRVGPRRGTSPGPRPSPYNIRNI